MSMGPVYGPQGGTPRVLNYNATSGADFIAGEVLILSSGECVEAGTNPAAGTILGVSMCADEDAPGFSMANQPSFVTYRTKNVPVALANGNVFKGKITNNSATYIAPVAADVGASYGITEYTGIWVVDKNKTTTNARVVIIKIDTDVNEVYFRFIESFCVEV